MHLCSFKWHTSCLRKQTNLIKAVGLALSWKKTFFISVSGFELLRNCFMRKRKSSHDIVISWNLGTELKWYLQYNLQTEAGREGESIIYFKARVYLLYTNCGRGSALEGCALSGEGRGPQGQKENIYLSGFIRKTLRQLLLRSEMWLGRRWMKTLYGRK